MDKRNATYVYFDEEMSEVISGDIASANAKYAAKHPSEATIKEEDGLENDIMSKVSF